METIATKCQGCGATFQREKKRGRPATKCSPCRDKVPTVLQFSKKTEDGGTYMKELSLEVVDGVTWIENTEPCIECEKTFMRPRKRGRPPVRCPGCQSGADAEKAFAVTVSDEALDELFKGDRKMLKGTPETFPKGNEAQCPPPRGCGRIFTSDSACEDHKVYGPNGNLALCKDPASLGMEPRERRGLPVWTRPTPKED